MLRLSHRLIAMSFVLAFGLVGWHGATCLLGWGAMAGLGVFALNCVCGLVALGAITIDVEAP